MGRRRLALPRHDDEGREGGDVRRRAGDAARHRPRHLPVRDLVERVGRRRSAPASACRRAPSAACSAWPRRTRRASARDRCRPSCPARSPSGCASRARSTAPRPAGRGAAAGTTRWSSATRRASTASTRWRSPSSTCSTTSTEVQICTGYRTSAGTITEFPADLRVLASAEPVYETMPGWSTPTKGVTAVRPAAGGGAALRHAAGGGQRRRVRDRLNRLRPDRDDRPEGLSGRSLVSVDSTPNSQSAPCPNSQSLEPASRLPPQAGSAFES